MDVARIQSIASFIPPPQKKTVVWLSNRLDSFFLLVFNLKKRTLSPVPRPWPSNKKKWKKNGIKMASLSWRPICLDFYWRAVFDFEMFFFFFSKIRWRAASLMFVSRGSAHIAASFFVCFFLNFRNDRRRIWCAVDDKISEQSTKTIN